MGLVCIFAGSGEHLIRTMLARECSTAMQAENAHQALLEAMQNKFISEWLLEMVFPSLSLCFHVSLSLSAS